MSVKLIKIHRIRLSFSPTTNLSYCHHLHSISHPFIKPISLCYMEIKGACIYYQRLTFKIIDKYNLLLKVCNVNICYINFVFCEIDGLKCYMALISLFCFQVIHSDEKLKEMNLPSSDHSAYNSTLGHIHGI